MTKFNSIEIYWSFVNCKQAEMATVLRPDSLNVVIFVNRKILELTKEPFTKAISDVLQRAWLYVCLTKKKKKKMGEDIFESGLITQKDASILHISEYKMRKEFIYSNNNEYLIRLWKLAAIIVCWTWLVFYSIPPKLINNRLMCVSCINFLY